MRSYVIASIFQLTHPRGVRPGSPSSDNLSAINFNSRTRVGCDQRRKPIHYIKDISTHAPAWGATRLSSFDTPKRSHFNSRTRVGCDHHKPYRLYRQNKFQLTHPRGVRRSLFDWYLRCIEFQLTHPRGVRRRSALNNGGTRQDFNSRTRVGCDAADTR